MNHPQITQRAFNTPLLVEPRKATAFLRGFGPRLIGAPVAFIDDEDGEDAPAAATPAFASLIGGELAASLRERQGYSNVQGVAIIPVSGVLIHRGAWIGQSSGQTSYEGIRAQIDRAAEDPMVRGIALEIDSFGGEVAGCFDLADRIRAVGRSKPVRAFVAEHAYSAAYAIAAQADRIIMPRSGGVGSIGVMCMHIDVSGAMREQGVTVTLIHAGKHKVDGNPYEPLPEGVQADLTSEMEALRGLFAATVAAGRGVRLGADAALATEARCLRAEEAVAAGLADAVGEPRAAFEQFVDEVNSVRVQPLIKGAVKMTAKTYDKTDDMDPDETEAMTDDDEADAVEEAPDEGEDESTETEPAAARERARIAAILGSPHASGRDSLARHLAFETDMTVAAAEKALQAAGGAGSLASRMETRGSAVLQPGPAPRRAQASMSDRMKARFAGK